MGLLLTLSQWEVRVCQGDAPGMSGESRCEGHDPLAARIPRSPPPRATSAHAHATSANLLALALTLARRGSRSPRRFSPCIQSRSARERRKITNRQSFSMQSCPSSSHQRLFLCFRALHSCFGRAGFPGLRPEITSGLPESCPRGRSFSFRRRYSPSSGTRIPSGRQDYFPSQRIFTRRRRHCFDRRRSFPVTRDLYMKAAGRHAAASGRHAPVTARHAVPAARPGSATGRNGHSASHHAPPGVAPAPSLPRHAGATAHHAPAVPRHALAAAGHGFSPENHASGGRANACPGGDHGPGAGHHASGAATTVPGRRPQLGAGEPRCPDLAPRVRAHSAAIERRARCSTGAPALCSSWRAPRRRGAGRWQPTPN
jgi:hypothetical protein